jgi:hypothetical protein
MVFVAGKTGCVQPNNEPLTLIVSCSILLRILKSHLESLESTLENAATSEVIHRA